MSDPTIDGMLRQLVRDAVRDVVREELALASGSTPIRNAADSYLSIAKAARFADVAPGTVRTWIRNGRLEAKRAGRVLRVGRIELERFLSGAPNAKQQDDTRRRAKKLLERGERPLRSVA